MFYQRVKASFELTKQTLEKDEFCVTEKGKLKPLKQKKNKIFSTYKNEKQIHWEGNMGQMHFKFFSAFDAKY